MHYKIKTKKDWLNSRGGRILRDLEEDEKGEYVWMSDFTSNKEKKVKVYVPRKYLTKT